jgi:hypothetical protein
MYDKEEVAMGSESPSGKNKNFVQKYSLLA